MTHSRLHMPILIAFARFFQKPCLRNAARIGIILQNLNIESEKYFEIFEFSHTLRLIYLGRGGN